MVNCLEKTYSLSNPRRIDVPKENSPKTVSRNTLPRRCQHQGPLSSTFRYVQITEVSSISIYKLEGQISNLGKNMFEEFLEPALKLFGFVIVGALLGIGFGFGWHVIKKREESK